jgi:sulfite reductase beta subunit-like hemoprotein
MTATTVDSAAGLARRPSGEGQRALGHREPLNASERAKQDDDPLHVRERIERIYSVRGFTSVDQVDLRTRFRWYGLYTQRVARFRQVLETEYLHRPLLGGPPPVLPEHYDHVGVHRQRDGRYYVGVAPVAGRVSGTLLGKLADVVEAHGSEAAS